MLFNIKDFTNDIADLVNENNAQNITITNIDNYIPVLESKITNIESVNNQQNTKITALENKTTVMSINIHDHISFSQGYSAGTDSFMYLYGKVVELYLVINGEYAANTSPVVCQLWGYKPYAANGSRRFPLIIPNGGWCSNAVVDTNSGLVTAVIPSGVSGGSVVLNAVYCV